MIIDEGQREYALPEPVDPHYCHFGIYSAGDPETNPHSHLFVLYVVKPVEILSMSEEQRATRGIPRMFAIVGADKLIWWPTSDKKTVGRLEYMPPPKVL